MKFLERLEQLNKQAASLGVNINYEPEVAIEDIEAITNEEWLAFRKKGIGGSDAGAICGVNAHTSAFDIALNKISKKPAPPVSPEQQYMFDYGHVMEPIILKLYAAKMGVGMLEDNKKKGLNYGCYTDRHQYKHPLHPFMLGDCDGMCITKEGEKIGLEFKTFNPEFKYMWKSGVFNDGTGVIKNPEYAIQVQHYMSVLNLTRFDLIAACSNNANDIFIITFYRDLERENSIISLEKIFWDNLQKGILPKATSISDDNLEKAKHYLGKTYNPDADAIELPASLISDAKKYLELEEQRKSLEDEAKALKEQQNLMKINFIQALGESGMGIINDSEQKKKYIINYKAGTPVVSVDKEKLRLLDPDLFEEVKKTSEKENRRFSIKTSVFQ